MTQHVLDYSQNPSGVELMDDYLAGMAENQLTNHSGLTRPSYAKAGTFWIDTSASPWVLKQFTGTSDVTVGTLDQTNLYFTAQRALNDKNGNDIAVSLATLTTADGQNVKVTGNQNIAGNKTFINYLIGQAGVTSESASTSDTRTGFFNAKNKRFSLGTVPSTNITSQVTFRGNDNEWAGLVEHNYRINGNNDIQLCIRRPDKLSSYVLGIGCTPSGSSYTYAPTPDRTSNNTNIATTAWGNNFLNGMRSNCITHVPQDIKLELSNGTLTLKAGSKVYVPNGSGVFDAITLSVNKTITSSMSARTAFLVYRRNQDDLTITSRIDYVGSGTTTPSTGWYYNTSTNKIYRDSLDEGISFPLAVVTLNGTKVVSIDQVFNGFGYIGSNVFVLPGVKGLIPDGRNSDGTLKNTEFTVSSVLVSANQSYTIPNVLWAISSDVIQVWDMNYYKYDENENKSYELYNGLQLTTVPAMFGSLTNGVVSNFEQKTAFHALDYNDFNNLTSSYLSSIAQGNYKEKSLIFNGPIGGGNITLSRPYTDFDALLIEHMGDNQNTWCATTLLTRYELDNRRANTPSNGSWALFNGQVYWTCTGASTTTSFVSSGENGSIRAIYGIKF